MSIRILDHQLGERLIAERRRSGADRYDEVWDGVYVMSPLANNEHQKLATKLARVFDEVLGDREDVSSIAGANVSDQETEWTKNYRCPDVVVVLPGLRAIDRGTHWHGGPDFVVEIVSEGDATYEKLDFYSKIRVRELLIVDRDPWALELYRLSELGKLVLVGRVNIGSTDAVASEVLGAEVSLTRRGNHPSVSVRLAGRSWHT